MRLWRRVRWVISGQHIRNETAEPGRAGGLAHLDKGRGVGVWGLPLSSVNNLEAGTLFALDPVLPIGVRLDQAGVDRKAVPTAAPRQCSAAALFQTIAAGDRFGGSGRGGSRRRSNDRALDHQAQAYRTIDTPD